VSQIRPIVAVKLPARAEAIEVTYRHWRRGRREHLWFWPVHFERMPKDRDSLKRIAAAVWEHHGGCQR
jgi:hypothetical protein